MRSSTRLLLVLLLAGASACAARYRREPVGHGQAHLNQPGAGERALIGVPVGARDAHEIVMHFNLPHALELHYELACPGQVDSGVVGETWEAYRERRLRELAAQRQREVDTAGAVGGALLGTVGAAAGVSTPGAEAGVAAEVDGQAVGAAIADDSLPEPELPPGDVGARTETRRFTIRPATSGQCTMTVWSERDAQSLAGVSAGFTVERLVDLRRERAEAALVADAAALDIRADVSATLVARGADPELRERQRRAAAAEAEARARAQAEVRARAQAEVRARAQAEVRAEAEVRARADAEVRARADAEARVRAEAEAEARARVRAEAEARARADARIRVRIQTGADDARARITAHLVAHGADPGLQARLRAEARVRAEAEAEARARVRAQAEARARADAEARYRAELEMRARARRVRVTALAVRDRLRGELIAGGADPEYRRKQHERELAAFEARARAETEARRRAEENARARLEVALSVRARVKADLLAQGAVDRPPRPAPPVYTQPPAPSATAVWIDGYHEWSGGAWMWSPGYWVEPPSATVVWLPEADLNIEGVVVVRPSGWFDRDSGERVGRERPPAPRDHRPADRNAAARRDHRDDSGSVERRDHRDDSGSVERRDHRR